MSCRGERFRRWWEPWRHSKIPKANGGRGAKRNRLRREYNSRARKKKETDKSSPRSKKELTRAGHAEGERYSWSGPNGALRPRTRRRATWCPRAIDPSKPRRSWRSAKRRITSPAPSTIRFHKVLARNGLAGAVPISARIFAGVGRHPGEPLSRCPCPRNRPCTTTWAAIPTNFSAEVVTKVKWRRQKRRRAGLMEVGRSRPAVSVNGANRLAPTR